MTGTEWTLTSERMPPEQLVLVCIKESGYRLLHITIAWYDESRQSWRTQAGFGVVGEVTHWMELPLAACL